jgi:cell division protein FtsB
MGLVDEFRRRARHTIGPTLAAVVFGYFLLHAFQGDRGLFAWLELRQQVAEAEQRLTVLDAERQRWEDRITLLRAASLDRDLLDERARIVAGLAAADDIVVLTGSAR